MLRNYIKIAFRHLWRNKSYTTLNLIGLAVTMATCLLFGLYVLDELRYDAFHQDADRIVVATSEHEVFRQRLDTPYPLGNILSTQIPGVEEVVRTSNGTSSRTVRRPSSGSDIEREQQILVADSRFFEFFSFPLEQGDPSSVLNEPNRAVITASMADRFFGDENAVGKVLSFGSNEESLEVTVAGVAEDVPVTSTIQFDMVVPQSLLPPSAEERQEWSGFGDFYTYARLEPGADLDTVSERLTQAIGDRPEDEARTFGLLPLSDVYLSDFYRADGFAGQRGYVYLFGTIAVLILLIATINYVNLATAQAEQRTREIGVRKTMGAHRGQLAARFLTETTMLSVGALALALGILSTALPAVNAALVGKELSLSGRYLDVLAIAAAFVLAVSVGAGAYPAFLISGRSPTGILRGSSTRTAGGGGWLRRGLVVVQFAVSAGLIFGTIAVYQQLSYVQTKDLGFDKNHLIAVDLPRLSDQRLDVLKQRAEDHGDVLGATIGDWVPGSPLIKAASPPDRLSPRSQTERASVELRPAIVDPNYTETLGISVIAGRSFSEQRPTDERNYLLNEAAAQAMGWSVSEAVGKPFTYNVGRQARPEGEVVGVLENFHIESLRQEIAPVVFRMRGDSSHFDRLKVATLVTRLDSSNIESGLDHVRQVMAEVASGASFDYTFLGDRFDAMYDFEQRLARIFAVLAGIAIVVACMGLFGLAAFAAQRRRKEIGIRKALGATVGNIVALLSKEFAFLVGVALIIGLPIAYAGMQRWLQDFAYRTDLGPLIFLLTATLAVLVAGLAVSSQALRAARTDPAIALRDE